MSNIIEFDSFKIRRDKAIETIARIHQAKIDDILLIGEIVDSPETTTIQLENLAKSLSREEQIGYKFFAVLHHASRWYE